MGQEDLCSVPQTEEECVAITGCAWVPSDFKCEDIGILQQMMPGMQGGMSMQGMRMLKSNAECEVDGGNGLIQLPQAMSPQQCLMNVRRQMMGPNACGNTFVF